MPGSSVSVTAANMPPMCTAGIVAEDDPRGERTYTRSMKVQHSQLEYETDGHGQVIDLTSDITAWLSSLSAAEGQLTVFVPGSTAVVTTIEFEPGAVRDLDEALERVAPSHGTYHHNLRWGDGNGFSHLRAAWLGPSLTVPVCGGRATLGTWQQIVLVECDLGSRERRVVLSFVGTTEEG